MTIRGTSWSTATTLLLAACTGDAARDATTLSVDTLSDGTVVVNNPVQGLWETDPGARWRIAEELRIGSATAEGADAFGDVGSLMIDQLGRFWVADRQANEVRVFDADGRFVRTVGGRGEGPAEFLDIGDIFPGPNGEVWIDDETMERFEVFDTSGTRIGGYNRDSRFWGGKWTDEGLLLSLGPHPESLEGVYTVYSRGSGSLLEPEGRVLEMPVPPPDPPMVEFKSPDGRAVRNIPPPFSPTRRWVLGSGWDAWYTNGRDLGGRYEIHRIDLESGDISNERVVIENSGPGHFDGMTIDEEGMVWIAVFGGWGVWRYDPRSGALLEKVLVPVEQITSCWFGGENLDELYITSCRYLMDEKALREQPLAGSLLRVKVDARGVPAYAYGG